MFLLTPLQDIVSQNPYEHTTTNEDLAAGSDGPVSTRSLLLLLFITVPGAVAVFMSFIVLVLGILNGVGESCLVGLVVGACGIAWVRASILFEEGKNFMGSCWLLVSSSIVCALPWLVS